MQTSFVRGLSVFCFLSCSCAKSQFLRGASFSSTSGETSDIPSGKDRRLSLTQFMRTATNRLHLGNEARNGRLLSDANSNDDQFTSTCIADLASLPETWRSSDSLRNEINNQSAQPVVIVAAAESAAREAFQELVDLVSRPGIVEELGTDALEPIINGAFAGSNMPHVREIGLSLGREILLNIAAPELKAGSLTCAQFRDSDLPTLVQYGKYLQLQMLPNATMLAVQEQLQDATNAALDNCRSVADYLGFDPNVRLNRYPASVAEASSMDDWIDPVYSMVLQAVDTLGMLGNSNLHMPNGSLDYVASFWAYLFDYPFPAADDYPDGINAEAFEQNSYIVTHLAYVVTGYQRYALRVSDAPWLFQYLRENFYPAVDSGHLDLYAEFVDNFRQYGCTSEDDQQTRDGTLMLLKGYEKAGRQWVNYRDWDDNATLSTYDVMHKAWTAYVGLHHRVLETPASGVSYSYEAQQAVGLALAKATAKRNASTVMSCSFCVTGLGNPICFLLLLVVMLGS